MVEDVYFIADDIVTALKEAGAVVLGPASNGQAALDLLASEPIDLAVLDINLQGESAYAVADALLARGTPLVFASGYGRGSIPDAYRLVPLWEKPFDAPSLVASLPALIAKGRSAI